MNSTPRSLTASFVAQALDRENLRIAKTPVLEVEFQNITTDSRKVIPGSLFIAIRGETFDGNQFVNQAVAQGARGILCHAGTVTQHPPDVAVFEVPDTLSAYRTLAAAWREEFSIPVVVVAGSAGKTTTKELLAAMLQGKWPRVLKTQGSQNGFVGIPLTLLELNPHHQAAIIEVGIDEIGAMVQHMNLVQATASVLTAIGPEHLEKLKDVPTVAAEESIALTSVAEQGGLVAVHLDDPWIQPLLAKMTKGRKLGFSLEQVALPQSLCASVSPDKKALSLEGQTFTLPLPGKHNASNFLAALTIARGLGLTWEEIKSGLTTFQGAAGRSEVKLLAGKSSVICDYYNAQPASVSAGLELLQDLSHETPRWACLGDMLELGPEEETFHRQIAPQLVRLQIEHVLLFGPRMRFLAEELGRLHYRGKFQHFDSHAQLAETLVKNAQPGDTILIKGSRGMKMEEVWKILEAYATAHWAHDKTKPHEHSDPASHA